MISCVHSLSLWWRRRLPPRLARSRSSTFSRRNRVIPPSPRLSTSQQPLQPARAPSLTRFHTRRRPQIPPTLGEEDEGTETIGSRDAQGLGALANNPAFGPSHASRSSRRARTDGSLPDLPPSPSPTSLVPAPALASTSLALAPPPFPYDTRPRRPPRTAQLVQGRLSGLIGRSSGYVESLPTAVQYRLTALKGVQRDHAVLEAEFQKEIFELEKRFADRYKPLYDRRRAIIEGSAEPQDDDVKKGVEAEEEEEESDFEDDDEDDEAAADKPARGVKPTDAELADAPKGIPEFWLTALKNHLGLSELITERDEDALKHLVDVRVKYPADKSGFTLVFEFSAGAQEFFANSTLEKTYLYQDEVGYEGDFVYDHAEGTKIEWKEGKDLTTRIETKKQRNKSPSRSLSLSLRHSLVQLLTLLFALLARPSSRSSSRSSPPPSPPHLPLAPLQLASPAAQTPTRPASSRRSSRPTRSSPSSRRRRRPRPTTTTRRRSRRTSTRSSSSTTRSARTSRSGSFLGP